MGESLLIDVFAVLACVTLLLSLQDIFVARKKLEMYRAGNGLVARVVDYSLVTNDGLAVTIRILQANVSNHSYSIVQALALREPPEDQEQVLFGPLPVINESGDDLSWAVTAFILHSLGWSRLHSLASEQPTRIITLDGAYDALDKTYHLRDRSGDAEFVVRDGQMWVQCRTCTRTLKL